MGLCDCFCGRLLGSCLRVEVGGLRVIVVGAGGRMGLSGGVSNLTSFFGFWLCVGECGLFGLEAGLVRFLVLGVLMRRGVFFEGVRGSIALPIVVCCYGF